MIHSVETKVFSLFYPSFSLCQSALLSNHEAIFVKESLARITVETAKRMWPQYWQSFFSDMNTLTQYGVRTCVWLPIRIPQLDSHLSSFPLSLCSFFPTFSPFTLFFIPSNPFLSLSSPNSPPRWSLFY